MSTKKNLIAINAITSINLLIGLVNNSVIAYLFGLTAKLDTYYVALIIPMLFMSLFVDFVGKNFLPVYSQEIKDNQFDKASVFASTIINSITVFSVVIILVLLVCSPALFKLISPGLNADTIDSTDSMFQILSVAMVFMGGATFLEYILQYHSQYIKVVVANLITSLTILVALLVFNERYAEFSLAIGYMGGQILRFVVLAFRIPHRHSLSFDFGSESFKRVLRNTATLVGSGLITRFKPVILRYFASMLAPGSISAYSMAQKLSSPIHQTSTIGVKMMSFSKSSKLYSDGKHQELGQFYTRVVSSVMFFIIPLTVWLGLCADEIITILFERGEFNREMHDYVYFALLGLLPSIVFLSICPLMSNGFYVIDKIKVPAILGPIDTVLYITVIWLLVGQYELLGLALANSLVFLIRFVVFAIFLGRYIDSFCTLLIFAKLLSYTFISISVFGLAYLLLSQISLELIRVGLILIAGFLMYLAIYYIKRDRSLQYILSIASR
ncbi:MAG: hypothetical protein K0U68_13365 [Gammaproteobacteria bacterium]|nr:hypothetical protein [Gammaproteobacteria bacterium]